MLGAEMEPTRPTGEDSGSSVGGIGCWRRHFGQAEDSGLVGVTENPVEVGSEAMAIE